MDKNKLITIGKMAAELGISTRTIRYYEEKGLIKARRSEGGYRLYNRHDRRRLQLILRGKHFGMSLEQILDILGVADTEPHEAAQIRKALSYKKRIMTDLQERLANIQTMIHDVEQLGKKMEARLAELEHQEKNRSTTNKEGE
ncbi:MAG: MerR family transcriptional regulator [Deltaproteobacteria bacterium]|nr:MAG: MerR family transcriptional regulator [Deltaproteobacteria bacterium]